MTAVVFIALVLASPPNQNSISRAADSVESLPWHAFLVPSVPNKALSDFGASAFAVWVFVGPMNCLHFLIAPSAISSIPMQTSELMNS